MILRDSLVLYVESAWVSPWVCSVFVTLQEKGLPFTTAIAMMHAGTGVRDSMHERTLTGAAPVLQHGAFWLAESLAIVEYLEEMFPSPRVLPDDVRDRARARQLMTWMRNDHHPLRRERSAEHIFYRMPTETLPALSPAARRCADDLVRVATRLGADERGAVFADRFCVLDAELAFALMRLVAVNHELPAPLVAYARAVWARPSVRAFVDHPRPPHPPPAG
jgi:glutathione S-transferase